MPTRVFAITAVNEAINLDAQGRGEVSFTVSNTTSRPIMGRAKVVALKDAKEEWLSIVGELERNFSPGGTHQFTVKIAVPQGTPAAKCGLCLNIVSVQKPDEDFTDGPTVAFEIKPSAQQAKPFPWWIVIILLVVLFVGGGVILWTVANNIGAGAQKDADARAAASASASASAEQERKDADARAAASASASASAEQERKDAAARAAASASASASAEQERKDAAARAAASASAEQERKDAAARAAASASASASAEQERKDAAARAAASASAEQERKDAAARAAAESVLVPAIIKLDGSTKATLEEHKLRLGKITAKREITSGAMVLQLFDVIIQIPRAGSRAKPGDSVDLVVKFIVDLPPKDEEAFNEFLEKLTKSGAYEKIIKGLPQ